MYVAAAVALNVARYEPNFGTFALPVDVTGDPRGFTRASRESCGIAPEPTVAIANTAARAATHAIECRRALRIGRAALMLFVSYRVRFSSVEFGSVVIRVCSSGRSVLICCGRRDGRVIGNSDVSRSNPPRFLSKAILACARIPDASGSRSEYARFMIGPLSKKLCPGTWKERAEGTDSRRSGRRHSECRRAGCRFMGRS